MDLAEIKKWWGYPDRKGNFNPRVADRVDWLIAEVERLEKALAYANRESDFRGKSWSACAERLTLSRAEGRREGMQEAARIASEIKVGYSHGSGFHTYTYDVGSTILTRAAAIREAAQENDNNEKKERV